MIQLPGHGFPCALAEENKGTQPMTTRTALLASSLLLLIGNAAQALPTLQPGSDPSLQPVAGEDLDQYVGWTVFGAARAPLGVVSKVDLKAGVIGVVGRHGEFALMHTSVLKRNGIELRAPTITFGEFAQASIANLTRRGSTLIYPNIIVTEPPLG
jgi:hypothetical protein